MMRTASILVAVLAASACANRTTSGKGSTPQPPATASATTSTSAAKNTPATNKTPAKKPSQKKKQPVVELEPLRIQVIKNKDGTEKVISFDARQLLDEGNVALTAGRNDQALARFDKLLNFFPSSRLVVPALYNAGLAHEGKRAWDAAIRRYRRLLKSSPPSRDAIDAHIRIGAVLSELQRWGTATKQFEAMLARTDLSSSDRVEGMARLGYVLVEQKNYARAEKLLEGALLYARKIRHTAPLSSTYYIAMAGYYYGRIPHRQALAIPLRVSGPGGDDQLTKDIKTKADTLRLAYDRYLVAVRLLNPYWSTAAAYQMSQMYVEFWETLVLAPVPPQLGPKNAEQYKKELHRQALVFLQKALAGHTKNVELAEAFKTSTPWSQSSRSKATEIAGILAKETSGTLVVPKRRRDGTPLPRGGTVNTRHKGYVPGRVDL